MGDEFVRLCAVGDVGENDNKAFNVADRTILLCNTKDGFLAVDAICTHQLQSLAGGRIRGCFIFCPLHGQRFDLRSGAPIGPLTNKPLNTYSLRVDDDAVYINPTPRDGAQG